MNESTKEEMRELIHSMSNLMAVTLLSAEGLQRELENEITREQKKYLHGIVKNEKECARMLKELRQLLLD